VTADIDPNTMNMIDNTGVQRLDKDAWQTFSNSRLMNKVSQLRNDIKAECNKDLLIS
jgi:hypothetical protein